MIRDTISIHVSRLVTRELASKWFVLPPETISELEKYYLLHWAGRYIIDKIEQDTPTESFNLLISHQGTEYKVVFLETTVGHMRMTDQFHVSFRKLNDLDQGWVLIKRVGA